MLKILLLEDDLKLASEVKFFLEKQGFLCEVVYDGMLFFKQVAGEDYNLYILDINVPGLNGMEVCKKIRQTDLRTPILMLTAYSGVEDKVNALNYGADDYLVKPFHLDELLARTKALLRREDRSLNAKGKVFRIADLVIDTTEIKVSRAGKEIKLTTKEYKLLLLLAKGEGRPISRKTIAEKVWDINFETGTNTIEVYISFLRNKIDKGFKNSLIHTSAGSGYYLKEKK
jgi:DNA-binding response OmpR family regulator